ncbi:hypothetical protein BA895_19080 [Humibacillus sp. DSM 29435]|nr:hypothetical protein BA895_19080 [Humibacillus sp. DSM 29435]
MLATVNRQWRPSDRAEQQIREVEVDVPSGCAALEVELSYPADAGDGAAGAAVLDLGLEGPAGYVGWSGGARRRFVVSEGWSTPGYLPVPVEAGVWRVLVGLHRVPPGGATMTLTVRSVRADAVGRAREAEPADPPPRVRPDQTDRRRRLPTVDGLTWLAGDFHSHTVHSDGSLSIGALAALAASRGLDFLAVTDHNTTSHHAHLPAAGHAHGIRLLPGQEVTRDIGHANAFGDIGFVDFRQPPTAWAADVAQRGGILSVNHPLAADCAWLSPLDQAPVAEVWHSSWAQVPSWGAPLAWWLLTPSTTPIGGSDFHQQGSDALPGSPTTWVLCNADGDGDGVLGGLRAGRTSVSTSVDGPLLLRDGDELVAVDADGLLLTGAGQARRPVVGDRVRLGAPEGPWWLEDDHRVVHALCR